MAYVAWQRATAAARSQLEKQLTAQEENYRAALSKLTIAERDRLVQYGTQILGPVFSQLQALAARYKEQEARLATLNEQAEAIKRELGLLQ
jgi:uncharacterized protein involved in exopolysaccharide biosynthesis